MEWKMDQTKVTNLLKEFQAVSDDWFKGKSFIEENYNFFTAFFTDVNLNNLASLTDDVAWSKIQEMKKHIHCFQNNAMAMKTAFGKHNMAVQKYIAQFKSLIDTSISLEQRLRNFKIPRLGENSSSEIFGNLFADHYVFFNGRDQDAVKFLEIVVPYKRGDGFIDKFLKYNKAIKPVIDLYEEIVGHKTELPINCEVDQFFSWLVEKNKSKTNIKYWVYAPGEKARFWNEFYENNIIGLGWDKLGDLANYENKNEIAEQLKKLENTTGSKKNDAAACWDFRSNISIGDVIFAKKGVTEYLGCGIVTSEYFYDKKRSEYKNCRRINWIKKNTIQADHKIAIKTLTDVTQYTDYVEKLKNLFEIGVDSRSDIKPESNDSCKYPLNTILYGPPGTGKTYNTINRALEIVGETPPIDRKEAIELFNQYRSDGQIEFITFHQNYSYEDFVEGIKPNLDNPNILLFKREPGVFKKICTNASFKNLLKKLKQKIQDEINKTTQISPPIQGRFDINGSAYIYIVEPDGFRYTGDNWTAHPNGLVMKFDDLEKMYNAQVKSRQDAVNLKALSGLANGHATYYFNIYEKLIKNYVLIIDEINRANISRVFGELITLIEDDKRIGAENELTVTLASGEPFGVPSNLYIIGTMNTADRSIALVDIALRRRFTFEGMYPNYDLKLEHFDNKNVNFNFYTKHLPFLKSLNEIIRIKKNVDYQIGHSFFMKVDKLENIINQKIIPLLNEYFMGVTTIIKEDILDVVLKGNREVVFDDKHFSDTGLLQVKGI